ncbi:MAG: type II toxin-antitoxin system Phd/YefM family antitoxin [Microbacteriaceae bacterium]
MDTITSSVSARELRTELSSIVGRVAFGHERIGLTRNGKLTAVVIGVDDLELLEQLEDAQDLAAFRAAKAQDDGVRVSLADLRADLRA